MSILAARKNSQRIKEIITVLSKQGFSHIFAKSKLTKYTPYTARFFPKQETISYAKRIRITAEQLGPTFIKLGQMLSTRSDILPQELIQELSKLQDNVPTFSFKTSKRIIEAELKLPLLKIFKTFNQKPIASASIGQVYEAVLRNGTKVAVKVQRPNIVSTIEKDIAIAKSIVKAMEDTEIIKKYKAKTLVEEFEKQIKKELNYEIEGANIDKFYENFKENEGVKIPKCYPHYTTEKILTLEFMEGSPLSKILTNKQAKTKKRIANKLIKSFFKQIIIDKFFHADPHPGNIFIEKNNIILLDFGSVGHLNEEQGEALASMLVSLIDKNTEELLQSILSIVSMSGEVDNNLIREDINNILEEFYSKEINEVNPGELLSNIFSVVSKNNMTLPREFILLAKSMMTIEGIIRQLYPKINIIETAKPFATKIIKQKSSPLEISKQLTKNFIKTSKILKIMPKKINILLDRLQRGSIKTELAGKEMDELEEDISSTGNRISMSILILALLLSSTIGWTEKIGPVLYSIPIFPLIGIVMASTLIILLFLAILKSNIKF